jgi:hypothetical protein
MQHKAIEKGEKGWENMNLIEQNACKNTLVESPPTMRQHLISVNWANFSIILWILLIVEVWMLSSSLVSSNW